MLPQPPAPTAGRGILNDWQITGITSLSSGEPVAVGGNRVIFLGSCNVREVGGATLNQTNLPTALGGGGRFEFGALNAVRSPRTVQLGAKIYI